MPMAQLKDNNATCNVLPPRYERFKEALVKSFEPRQAHAIARMLCEIDEGAGEVTAIKILEEEGGFDPNQARTLATQALLVKAVKNLLKDDAA